VVQLGAFPLVKGCVVRGGVEPPTFRFSGCCVSAGHSTSRTRACDPRATSVLDHDRLRQPGGVTVGSQVRQRGGDLGIPAVNRMQVPIGATREACPRRRIRSLTVAPVAAAGVWPVRRRSWKRNPGMAAVTRARSRRRRYAAPGPALPAPGSALGRPPGTPAPSQP
jgi:hypothetical protein